MGVIYDKESETFYERREVEGQTVELGMNLADWDYNHKAWYNIYITVYNKRKDAFVNMDRKVITGKNPFATFAEARDMFKDVEAAVLRHELVEGDAEEVIIFCTWVDNRRRDAYYRVLSRYGYDWGITLHMKQKCIRKVFTLNDVNPEVFDYER